MRNLFSIGIVGETSSADINSIIFDYSTFSRSIPKKISHGDNRYTPIFKLNKRTVENSDLKKLYKAIIISDGTDKTNISDLRVLKNEKISKVKNRYKKIDNKNGQIIAIIFDFKS